MFRIPLALFVAVVLAGCDTMPVRYVQVYYPAQAQSQLVLPQAPMPAGTLASAPIVVPVTPAPQVVYVQPLVYFNPIADIAAIYMFWRLAGGWYGGHHHRRGL